MIGWLASAVIDINGFVYPLLQIDNDLYHAQGKFNRQQIDIHFRK